jgi:GH25 family lysozyme M1 (1,4-beta-N-acetylmuramidase)
MYNVNMPNWVKHDHDIVGPDVSKWQGTVNWHVWQYTSTANVPGVSGNCDVSVVRTSAIWNSDFYQ